MNVIIDNLNLTAKQLRELRAAIKARYTPEKVKASLASKGSTEKIKIIKNIFDTY